MVEKIIKIGSLIISFSLLIFFLIRFNLMEIKKTSLDLDELNDIKQENFEIYQLVDKTIEEIEDKKIEKIKTIDSMDHVIKLKTNELNDMERQYNETERNKNRLMDELEGLYNKVKTMTDKNSNMLLDNLKLTKENKELKRKLFEIESVGIPNIVIHDTIFKTNTIYERDTIYLTKKELKKNKK